MGIITNVLNVPQYDNNAEQFQIEALSLISSLNIARSDVARKIGYPDVFQTITSNTTITVPKGVRSMRAYVFGKGGNSASGGANNNAGGGGGGCQYGEISLSGVSTVNITIASGTITLSTAGLFRLTGNSGSNGVGTAGGAGGAAGTSGTGVTNFGAASGGNGGNGSSTASSVGTGGASGSPLGAGGSGANSSLASNGGSWGAFSANFSSNPFSLAGQSGRGMTNSFTDPLVNMIKSRRWTENNSSVLSMNNVKFNQIPGLKSQASFTSSSFGTAGGFGGGGSPQYGAGFVAGGAAGNQFGGVNEGGAAAVIIFWR
jgi:hypothetical protein